MIRFSDGSINFLDTNHPVEKIKIYKNGCAEIVRGEQEYQSKLFDGVTRGIIKKMSNKSVSRLIMVVNATEVHFASFLTLTYPQHYPTNGDIVKDDIRYITQWVKRKYDTEYLWFLEFQKRGAPHIHVLLEVDEISPKMRADVGLQWVERIATASWFEEWLLLKAEHARQILASEVSKMAQVACRYESWSLIREPIGARKYVTKYAAKQYQKDVPKRYSAVGRFWGCSRSVTPKPQVEVDVTDDEVRDYLSERGHRAADWDHLPKFLFNIKSRKQPAGANGQS